MSDAQFYVILAVFSALYLLDWHYERKIIRETERLQDLVEDILLKHEDPKEQ